MNRILIEFPEIREIYVQFFSFNERLKTMINVKNMKNF